MGLKLTLLLLVVLFGGQTKQFIDLTTKGGDHIYVNNGLIYYNKKPITKKDVLTEYDLFYQSRYNRLIEQDSSIVLFLEVDNRPNLNQLVAFNITKNTATKLAAVVYNDQSQGIGPAPFTDMDNDGNLEIGGFDLTESYDAKDSMYYNPSKYYEISKGKVIFDSALTKQMDTRINGLYLKNPLDENGNCCVVIKKPVKK